MYTPSMLSSAAIATAAALGMKDSDFDINELVRRLQTITRVDYVSSTFFVITHSISKLL